MAASSSAARRRLTGARIVVTGSAGAFGSGLVSRLESLGSEVVGIDLVPGADRSRDLSCDVRDAAAVAAAVEQAATSLGGIDVLVNNAGIGTAGPTSAGLGPEERAVFEVNAVGAWNVVAAAMPHLVRSDRRGHVVNVASLLAVVSLPYVAAYAASKRSVVALSDVLRAEQPAGGVTVTTVYPGYVPTGIHAAPEARSGLSLEGVVPEESVEQVVAACVRAIVRRPRDQATSPGGAVALRLARAFPATTDRIVRRQVRRNGMLRPTDWRLDDMPPTGAGEA